MPTLRLAGSLEVEIQAAIRELEAARGRSPGRGNERDRRRRDVARLRRALVPMRSQLVALERRLEELARRHRSSADLATQWASLPPAAVPALQEDR
jgi:hypothetical protein